MYCTEFSRWPSKEWKMLSFISKGKTVSVFIKCHAINGGPGSSVGIATGYGRGSPGIESQWRRDFRHLSISGPGTHPASCTIGSRSFPGIKSAGA